LKKDSDWMPNETIDLSDFSVIIIGSSLIILSHMPDIARRIYINNLLTPVIS